MPRASSAAASHFNPCPAPLTRSARPIAPPTREDRLLPIAPPTREDRTMTTNRLPSPPTPSAALAQAALGRAAPALGRAARRPRPSGQPRPLGPAGGAPAGPAGRGPRRTARNDVDREDAFLLDLARQFAAAYLEILATTVAGPGLPGAVYRDRHSAFAPTSPGPADPVRRRSSASSDGSWSSSGSARSSPVRRRPRAGSSGCGGRSRIGLSSSSGWPV